jgi:dihydrofolate synthase/folylpolyglutamate synthase
MAFAYFAEQKLDIAIIEVGLGGRFDSTNIIYPELSIITNIGWDHMNLLGDSLEKIAFEKAGIIKEDVPVVIGEISKESRPVFEEKATYVGAPIIFAQEKKYVTDWKYEAHQLFAEIATHTDDTRETYHLDLSGIYQTKNLLTVLEAIHQLRLKGWKIDQPMIKEALQHVKRLTGLHGRWEIIHYDPIIILDVGHNMDGMKQIAEQLEISTYNHLHIIIGMVKDKEVEKVLDLLPRHASYYFTNAQIPRALDAEILKSKAAILGLKGDAHSNVNVALQYALTNADKKDMILVCGSVFIVGEVTIF